MFLSLDMQIFGDGMATYWPEFNEKLVISDGCTDEGVGNFEMEEVDDTVAMAVLVLAASSSEDTVEGDEGRKE